MDKSVERLTLSMGSTLQDHPKGSLVHYSDYEQVREELRDAEAGHSEAEELLQKSSQRLQRAEVELEKLAAEFESWARSSLLKPARRAWIRAASITRKRIAELKGEKQ